MMRVKRIYLLATVCIVCLCVSAADYAASPPKQSRDYDIYIRHNGIRRLFKVHVPLITETKPWPVVIALHGGGGDAKGSVKFFNLNKEGDDRGYMIVYPQGTGRRLGKKLFGAWNAGQCCGKSSRLGVDDVGFIAAMLDHLAEKFPVDLKRVYVTGHSNGALMAHRLVCELSDRITAIAVGGAHGAFDLENCHPKKAVPILHFHGMQDKCAPIAGGECGGCFSEFLNEVGIKAKPDYWTCPPLESYISQFRKLYQCSDQTHVTYQNGDAQCVTADGCQNNAEVTLCLIQNMGHVWPGHGYNLEACRKDPEGKMCMSWKEMAGPLNNDFQATTEMFKFFEKYK